MADGPVEKKPFSKRGPESVGPTPHIDPDKATPVTPFQVIHRGEDTIDADDRVTFSDFSPRVLPADAVEEDEVEPAPKVVSAPEPASSPESTPTTEPETLGTSAQAESVSQEDAAQLAAVLGDGESNPNEPSKPSSSSDPKNGQSEQPA